MPSVAVVGAIDGYGGLSGGVIPSDVGGVVDPCGGLAGGVLPSGTGGGTVERMGADWPPPPRASVLGGGTTEPGGANLSTEQSITRSSGEEIPQTIV